MGRRIVIGIALRLGLMRAQHVLQGGKQLLGRECVVPATRGLTCTRRAWKPRSGQLYVQNLHLYVLGWRAP